MPQTYQEISSRKRQEREDRIPVAWKLSQPVRDDVMDVTSIPRTCGVLTERELDITENYDAATLVSAMVKKKLSAVDVTTAFCKRAAIAQQVTNCLTEILFDDAIARAKYLDQYLAEKGRPFGPLHGLPISLKDCFSIPGYDTSNGLTAWAFKPASRTSPLSQALLSAGSIFYVKTTVPQAMLCLDTHSPLFGRTTNPHNRALAAGGSSGGEGALIAMGGSIIGIGTDLGGSIRVPSAWCGIYGLKPSSGKVPSSGLSYAFNSLPEGGNLGVTAAVGPMARNVQDLGFFFDALASTEPWRVDPDVRPFSGTTPPKPQKLSIGVLRNDGVAMPLPPVTAVLNEVAEKLSSAGHEVHEISLPLLAQVNDLTNKFFTVNGNRGLWQTLDSVSEPLSPWLAERVGRHDPVPLSKVFEFRKEKGNIEEAVLKEMWERPGKKLDVILAPVSSHPATPHDKFCNSSYCQVFNLLDYPGGVIPVRKVKLSDLEVEIQGDPLGRWDEMSRSLWKDRENRNLFLNSPLAVQVIGRKATEVKLCAAMEVIDSVLNYSTSKKGQTSSSRL